MPIDTTIVGGGMIVHDQVLPTLYHLQRLGHVGRIAVVATQTARLRDLVSKRFRDAFPDQAFDAYPALSTPDGQRHPDLWRDVVADMPPRQLVVVATPDELHNDMVTFALEHNQHVLCVKPLVHRYAQAEAIMKLAHQCGLFVGVEYHKRFDRRSLEARREYRDGRLGVFRCGEAKLVEPYYYRHSNFQNWFTKDRTDPFTYIGCHYVDLVYFITGLRPTEVNLQGVTGEFPNGREAYMWSAARVVFDGGAILSVLNGLGYPDRGAGTNDQGMCLFCEGTNSGAVVKHDDQFRGASYGYVDDHPADEAVFRFINPDYFRLVPWQGEGLKPVGYGYESIEANVLAAMQVDAAGDDVNARRRVLKQIDDRHIIATPANSYINELVVEAARLSITNDGARVAIEYGDAPRVRLV
jgi:D-galacturonate reductase